MSYITLEEAITLTSNYRTLRANLLKTEYSTDVLPLSITLPASEVIALLSQDGVQSLRIYPGADTDTNKISFVLVGVDGGDEDLIPSEEYIIVDRGVRCPNDCPPSSDLNS